MPRQASSFLLVFTLFVAVYIAPLGLRPLVTPDEFRYAEIPREMLVDHDWVTPHLDGFLYFEKPVLGYWLTAASISLFGERSFSVRLPAALSAGLCALLVLWLVGRHDREWSISLLAVAVLLTSLQVFGMGVFAVLDGPFTALVTGTMACFFAAYTSTGRARQRTLLALAGALAGGAFMTKGFIAFAIPVLSIVPFLAFQKRLASAFRLSWIPALSAVAVSLPWSVVIYSRSPEFWPYFVWTEHVQRLLSPASAQHPQPAWFFLAVFAVGALPWSPMIPAAVSGLKARSPRDALLTFSACWFASTFVFFSLSSGKLATYILPVFPPFAILTAVGLESYLRSGRRLWWRTGALTMAALTAAGAVALFSDRLALYDSSNQWRPTILATALLIWAVTAAAAARLEKGRVAITLFALSPLLAFFSLHLILPALPLASHTPGAFLARHASRAHPGTTVVSDIATIQAACWAFERDDILILGGSGELSFGVEHNPSAGRHLTCLELEELLAGDSAQDVLLVAESQKYEACRHALPDPVFEDTEGGVVVAEYRSRTLPGHATRGSRPVSAGKTGESAHDPEPPSKPR